MVFRFVLFCFEFHANQLIRRTLASLWVPSSEFRAFQVRAKGFEGSGLRSWTPFPSSPTGWTSSSWKPCTTPGRLSAAASTEARDSRDSGLGPWVAHPLGGLRLFPNLEIGCGRQHVSRMLSIPPFAVWVGKFGFGFEPLVLVKWSLARELRQTKLNRPPGDSWDAFERRLPEELLRHINGNVPRQDASDNWVGGFHVFLLFFFFLGGGGLALKGKHGEPPFCLKGTPIVSSNTNNLAAKQHRSRVLRALCERGCPAV